MKICIKNGRVIDPASNIQGIKDIWIKDGKVVSITGATEHNNAIDKAMGIIDETEDEDSKIKYIDAKGKWVTPGFIDMHVHFREPGYEYKEDIESGSRAAAKGGFTGVCVMPNTCPPTDEPYRVKNIKAKEQKVRLYPIATVTKGMKGIELTDFKALKDAGACGFSDDGLPVLHSNIMKQAMEEAKKVDSIILSHAEDLSLPPGDKASEYLMVGRDLLLAEETGCQLHFCHVTTEKSLELIKSAKRKGLKITAETAPHYISYTDKDRDETGKRKMNPPLREESDRRAIEKGIKDKTIDAIATDHAPHSKEEKAKPYEEALNGVIGLETSFAAAYTYLVKNGRLSPMKLIRCMSTNPAKILGIKGGNIKIGEPADITVIDIDREWEVKETEFESKSKNSAFLGEKLYGKPILTMVNGEIVYSEKNYI